MRILASLFRSSRPALAAACLVAALLVVPAPAPGAQPPSAGGVRASAPSPVLAAWYSKYTAGLATRSRVVQICVVTMCLALFILMKKFAPSQCSVVSGQWSVRKKTGPPAADHADGEGPSGSYLHRPLTTDH